MTGDIGQKRPAGAVIGKRVQRGSSPWGGRPLFVVLSVLFVLAFTLHGPARVLASQTTQEKLDEAKAAASQTQSAIDESTKKSDELAGTKEALQGELYDLNQRLSTVSQEITALDGQIQQKQEEISGISESLEEVQAELASTREDIRELEEKIRKTEAEMADTYSQMKEHVRYLYERGTVYYLEILLDARNLSDYLNRMHYIELLSAYDRRILEEYRQKAAEAAREKEQLREREASLSEKEEQIRLARQELADAKDALEDMYSTQAARHGELSGLVTQTAGSISLTQQQQEQIEAGTEELRRQLEEQNSQIEELQRQLEEERRLQELADRLAWADISQVQHQEGDLYLLANLIYCEAGNQPYDGQLAVGAVVMNRVRSEAFPNTISGVIYQKWQFTPAMTGRLALALSRDDATPACYQAAQEAIAGLSPVGDCLFFRTPVPEVTPKYVIGDHIFY